jgi:hypothetical protein
MATTASGDVKIYHPQMVGAFVETIQQNVDAFNAASAGALVVRNNIMKGQYEYEAFFQEVSNISRRNPASESSSTVASTKLTHEEFIGVKLNRRNGPYEWNISAAHLAGFDPQRFSVVVGEQTAVATPQEMLDRMLGALEAKLDNTAALKVDRTGGDIRLQDIVDGLQKLGDAAGRIRLIVMHSKPFYDLLKSQVTSAESVYASDVWGGQVYGGTPATLGRPVLVTDSASLVDFASVSTGSPNYSTLLLTADAAEVDISEPPLAVAEGPITGSDNLFIRWQAEYSYNLKVKGCRYNTSTGVNPTDANVATASNWVTAVGSNKLLPGAIIESK